MKKIIALLLAMLTLVVPFTTAFAQTNDELEVRDIYISNEDFNKLEHVDSEGENALPRATGLIVTKSLSLAKDGNYLIIKAETRGTADVKNCGFTYIKLQQYKNYEWVDCATFKDCYNDSAYCLITKSIAAPKGYAYRVVAQHYAKKNILSTEKIDNTTSSIYF